MVPASVIARRVFTSSPMRSAAALAVMVALLEKASRKRASVMSPSARRLSPIGLSLLDSRLDLLDAGELSR